MSHESIAALVFVTVFLFIIGIWQLKAGEQEKITARMNRIFSGRVRGAVETVNKNKSNIKTTLYFFPMSHTLVKTVLW